MAGIRGEPIRGGTRGGQAEFKWSNVVTDKDRENYLGHSVLAPAGRWQKNKDVNWYNKEQQSGSDARAQELKKIKQAEEDALAVALGYAPTPRRSEGEDDAVNDTDEIRRQRHAEKEQKRLEKAARKEGRHRAREERRAQKERSRSDRSNRGTDVLDRRSRASRSRSPESDAQKSVRRRSRSPHRSRARKRSRSRSRSPERLSKSNDYRHD